MTDTAHPRPWSTLGLPVRATLTCTSDTCLMWQRPLETLSGRRVFLIDRVTWDRQVRQILKPDQSSADWLDIFSRSNRTLIIWSCTNCFYLCHHSSPITVENTSGTGIFNYMFGTGNWILRTLQFPTFEISDDHISGDQIYGRPATT